MPPIRLHSFVEYVTEKLSDVIPGITVQAIIPPGTVLPHPYAMIKAAPFSLGEESGPTYAQWMQKYYILVVQKRPDEDEDMVLRIEQETNEIILALETGTHIDTDAPEMAGHLHVVSEVDITQQDAEEDEYEILLAFTLQQDTQRGYV
jgi:hypothetical protein